MRIENSGFLQLHDRCRKFLHARGRKIKDEPAFKNADNYRNDIAHEGVERIDFRLMEELHRNAYELVRHSASSSDQQS